MCSPRNIPSSFVVSFLLLPQLILSQHIDSTVDKIVIEYPLNNPDGVAGMNKPTGPFMIGMLLDEATTFPQYTFTDTSVIWESGEQDTLDVKLVKQNNQSMLLLRTSDHYGSDGSIRKKILSMYVIAHADLPDSEISIGTSIRTLKRRYPKAHLTQYYCRNGIFYFKPKDSNLQYILDPSCYLGPPLDFSQTHIKWVQQNLLDDNRKVIGILVVRNQ